ncbi:MAG: hypothetical protein KKC71_05560 [Chloroflexi bacterium]|nr:hypothetical protein [Chloroflexota bacterium]
MAHAHLRRISAVSYPSLHFYHNHLTCAKSLTCANGRPPDRRSLTVAAASVLAKTARDALMRELDGKYPGYGFARHKGYGTPQHQEAIRRMGLCEIHRKSFAIHRVH